MDYIFTEVIIDIFYSYVSLNNIFSAYVILLISAMVDLLPYIVKYLIGYCHFYYQLGYGLLLYIYIYRVYKAKKTKKLKHLYGNSIINWVLFNFFIFNKFFLNKNIIILTKNLFFSTLSIIKFLFDRENSLSLFYKKINKIFTYINRNSIKFVWTPLFKKSSYITLLTFLKRFSKRK